MIPVSLAVIPEGTHASTLGALLGPLGVLTLVAALVTMGALFVVGLVNAGRHGRTATSPRRDKVMRAAVSAPWFCLARAHGQQHAAAKEEKASDQELQALADEAYKALKRALELDPGQRRLARALAYVDDPAHLEGDNDLETLADDPRIASLLR